MNKFAVTLAIVAVLAYTASATPCTDICQGECTVAKQGCDFTKVLGNLCQTTFDYCTQGCGASCHCQDSCAEQCGGKFAECQGDGSNLIAAEGCAINLGVCEEQCLAKCSFDTTAGVINSIAKPAA